MEYKSNLRGNGSMGRESEHGDRARAKNGYGRESVGHTADTGIRSGDPRSIEQPDVEPEDGRPSRQTSTAGDMKGQV